MEPFLAVVFEKDNTSSVILSKWLIDSNNCFFPNVREYHKSIKENALDKKKWSAYKIEIQKSFSKS